MFTKISFYLFVKPISYLPFGVLYVISDFLYLLMYKIIGYRKKVVWANISNSFPNKTEAERKLLMDKFFHHFFDLIVESIKLFSISNEEILRRCVFLNPELINETYKEGKSVVLVGGHFNNWEILAVAIDQQMKHRAVGIYMPLSNAFYDQIVRESRSKYGLQMIPVKEVATFFAKESKNLTATIFGADQSPTNTKKVFWTTFLHQETAVAAGAERYAIEYNYPVYFGKIGKVKRGFYTFEVVKITDHPQETKPGEITLAHVAILEDQIVNQPEYWLWSHRRWKRKRKPEEKMIG